ncbi:MAG TPA: diaminopimelate epimerase, partial [Actinomycetota bacterium]|nr:diaminopimelate epimerase [Actinomycetota bacterium]
KMHGAGNDFVMVEDLQNRITPGPELVRLLCDRHFGVGADGLIRVAPADDADFFMDYYNADGEAAEMCGNGIRCLAKFVADRGLVGGDKLRVGTRAGIKDLELFRGPGGDVERVRVDMGPPILERKRIPLSGPGDDALRETIEVDDFTFVATALSMGNPHCVLFVTDLDAVPFGYLGPTIEMLPLFPQRANIEFVQVLSRNEVRTRVWERGVGETLACGTGACAIAVASALRGFTDRQVSVHLPGGTLEIDWAADGRVFMTGPAEEVFRGQLDPRFIAQHLKTKTD